MKELEIIEKQTKSLWEGKGCEINEVTEAASGILDKIEKYVPMLEQMGIDFPMEYVREAISNLSTAIETKDDYVLADCLFYEWREIGMVLSELIEELK